MDRWTAWLLMVEVVAALPDTQSWWLQTVRHTSPVATSTRCPLIPSNRSITLSVYLRQQGYVGCLGLFVCWSVCLSVCLSAGLLVLPTLRVWPEVSGFRPLISGSGCSAVISGLCSKRQLYEKTIIWPSWRDFWGPKCSKIQIRCPLPQEPTVPTPLPALGPWGLEFRPLLRVSASNPLQSWQP